MYIGVNWKDKWENTKTVIVITIIQTQQAVQGNITQKIYTHGALYASEFLGLFLLPNTVH